MNTEVVSVRHPLLDQLRRFDAEAARLYPAAFDNGLGQLGMLLYSDCKPGGYWCMPNNSIAFATTGGDGVHFSFIVEDGQVTESSPVIVTVPMNIGEPADCNLVVADCLRNFLRFGLIRGYFALEQLAYHRDLTLQVYSSPTWKPTEDWHDSVGYDLERENFHLVRELLAETFQLLPLSYTAAEFEALQDKYQHLLVYSSRDEW
jgi:hypothetical protein